MLKIRTKIHKAPGKLFRGFGFASRGFMVAIAIIAIFTASRNVNAQPPDNPTARPNLRAEARALDRVIAQLADEAEAAREAGQFEFSEPSIKNRWAEKAKSNTRLMATFSDATILNALIEPQSRDAFVDIYIRWQLTSYEPIWQPLTDRQFGQFMQQMPAMVENPKSNQDALRKLEYADNLGPMSPEVTAQFKAFLAELDEQEKIAAEMNRPGREFREWVLEQLGDGGAHPIWWKAETLAALIFQGWQVSTEKGNFTRDLADAANDDTFTDQQRRMILDDLLSISKTPKRPWLKEVTWLADGSVDVSFYNSYISKANIEKWAERLLGEKINID